jgi:N6-L-threonylcarbamoyladenine synthase
MHVRAVGQYELLGETGDDAAGEAFDKTAQLLGLGYPGGPAVSRLARDGRPGRFKLPRPMLRGASLDFSFSGLKTAVLTLVREQGHDEQARADIALAFQEAIVDVLATKAVHAIERTGLRQLVVAGGVGANAQLRHRLADEAQRHGFALHYPPLELCTDNGAMIAFAGALRLAQARATRPGFTVRPRWELSELAPPGAE